MPLVVRFPGLAPIRSRSALDVRPTPNAHRGIVMLGTVPRRRINACHAAVLAPPATRAQIAINVLLEDATDSPKMTMANGTRGIAPPAAALWETLVLLAQ